MPPALFSPTFMVLACCSINLPTNHVCKMFMFLNPLLLRGFATISTYEIDFFMKGTIGFNHEREG